MVRIERAAQLEQIEEAAHLMDGPVLTRAATRFLTESGHHLLLAYDSTGKPVGFVSGVETTHPDKGTEMFLYELAVDEPRRKQGIGTALVNELDSLARSLGSSDQLFPPSVVEMIAIAEESNTLDKTLIDIADSLEKRSSRQLELLVKLLEPVMLLVMAAVVLVVVMGLLLPIFKMGSAVSG